MLVNNQPYQSIWPHPEDKTCIQLIDQRWLPHQFVVEDVVSVKQMATAIREMHLRGAPLIGAAAAWGMYLACHEASEEHFPENIRNAAELLRQTRPTAVDLFWAIEQQLTTIQRADGRDQAQELTFEKAKHISAESAERCRMIGVHGLYLIRSLYEKRQQPINLLTHCNAGWLACVDYGTATAPIYAAHDAGIPVHVWVDETRPRNQGARLTAWELQQHGVPHTVITDNAGGHLMQHEQVDLLIVGTDRTTRQGDVANKIGTYLKALAAHDNGIPFYVALPSASIDWKIRDGLKEIPIEKRGSEEVTHIQGLHGNELLQVQLTPTGSPAVNYGFDVTPARLVSGLITERGICAASESGLLGLFPEFA